MKDRNGDAHPQLKVPVLIKRKRKDKSLGEGRIFGEKPILISVFDDQHWGAEAISPPQLQQSLISALTNAACVKVAKFFTPT